MASIDKGEQSRSRVFACRKGFEGALGYAMLNMLRRDGVRFVFFGKAQCMKKNPGNGKQQMKEEKEFEQPEIQLEPCGSERKCAEHGKAYLECESYECVVFLSVRLLVCGFKRSALTFFFKVRFGGEDIVYYRDDS